ncbi:hypothetical protein EV128_12597 [Rhizobium azibense]|nr:hypothetical protein EV128_12597 [Rhizobium azibense]
MTVSTRYLNFPALLYRVGYAEGSQGLWYDAEGRETGLIHTLSNAVAAGLPMAPNPVFKADGRAWISATDTLPGLANWFSHSDMIELIDRGYQLEEIGVHRYRYLQFPTYGHQVFCMEDVIFKRAVDPMLPYMPMARAA